MKKINLKSAWPYLVAVLLFLVITLAFMSPLLEGKKMMQSDIIHWKGAAKEIVDFRDKTGKEPLWTNSMFGGMPAYQISTRYTGNLLGVVDNIITLGLPHPANMLFLYFIGFFILLLVLKVNPWLSVAGAIGYAFSSYFLIIIDAGHNSQAHAIGYVAPVLAGMILTLRKKYLWGFILTALFLSLEVKQNHLQITYYLALSALILGIVELAYSFRNKTFVAYLKSVGLLVVAVIFAVLTNLSLLWTTYEYGKYTIRGKSELSTEKSNRTSGLDKDYATQWSYGIGETFTLLIPDFNGGASSDSPGIKSNVAKALRENSIPEENISQFVQQGGMLYFGKQPWTSPVYAGAIMVFLFVFGLIVVRGPLKWWLVGATLLSIMLAWGHNFMWFTDLFLNYIPGYNKFRAVTMILVIAELSIPLLGLLSLKVVFDEMTKKETLNKALYISLGITGGFALIFALVPDMFLNVTALNDASLAKSFPDWLMQAIRLDRIAAVKADSLRSLIFILLAGASLWLVINGKLKKEYAYAGLIVLVLSDMFTVAKRYLNNDSFTSKSRVENPYEASTADEVILRDKTLNYKVLNLTVNPLMDASTSYFHKSLGGYHGAKLRRYQELFETHIEKNNLAVVNMLNTRYVIVPDDNKQPVAQVNPEALGNAWFVGEVQLVDNADQELAALNGFDPSHTAVVDKKFSEDLKGWTPAKDSLARITLEEYQPNYLKYSSTSATDGLAVFSEIWYPLGWDAFIDGKPANHFRANYLLRAMVIPAGNHIVEFRFEPASYYTGEKVSMISSSILILLLIAGAAFGAWRQFSPRE
jgi:hypothetical protein